MLFMFLMVAIMQHGAMIDSQPGWFWTVGGTCCLMGLTYILAIPELPPHATNVRAQKTKVFTALPQCNMSARGQKNFKRAERETSTCLLI